MFELDPEVRKWRTRLERRSSLSARELDELEDHLRARFTLELDLNPALTPAGAFTTAVSALGEAKAISREFAKAGRPRWRRLLLAGWALYGASFFLPVEHVPPEARQPGLTQYGYEVFLGTFAYPTPFLMLANLAMIMSLSALWIAGSSTSRRFLRCLQTAGHAAIGATALGLGMLSSLFAAASQAVEGPSWPPYPGPAFWVWCVSFLCVAAALWSQNDEFARAGWRRWAG